MDPNTLNLDPETEVGSNLDPDPRVNLSIWKMVKLVLEQTSANNLIFLLKKNTGIREWCLQKKFHKIAEYQYRYNLDPDPQHWKKLLAWRNLIKKLFCTCSYCNSNLFLKNIANMRYFWKWSLITIQYTYMITLCVSGLTARPCRTARSCAACRTPARWRWSCSTWSSCRSGSRPCSTFRQDTHTPHHW